MHRILGRRLPAGLAAAAAACTFAGPAGAAPSTTVKIAITPATVAAGGHTYVAPILYATDDLFLPNATMTYEFSGGLTGVTMAGSLPGTPHGSRCAEVSPVKLVCTANGPAHVGPGGTVAEYRIEIAAPTAALGETGKLTATFAADGIKPVTRTTDVTVAEGVDLVAGGSTRTTAKPGADFTASLQVRNTTERVVHGAALAFGTDYGFSAPAAARFANCYYVEDQLNSCTFDQELQPGATYQAVVPYRLRPDTYAPSSVVGDFEWLTSGDYADLRKFIDDNGFDGPGRPGAGPKLELRALPAKSALAEPKQTDTDADNNWQDLTVEVAGKQGANLAAIGASLTGDAGDTVTATIGVANAGPATIDRGRNGGEAAVVVVSIPAGTKVVGLPDGCYPTQDGYLGNPNGKGLAEYGCFTDPVFPARTTVTWPFRLQLTEQVVNGTGWVEVNPPCACDRFHDANTKDNVATIVVNPRTAAGHGGAGGTGDTGGQGGGDGGGLPITGPRAGLFGGLGLLLVAAGIGGVVLARRRRTRFEV